MSLAQLHEHRRVWRRKPVLARIYGVWFDALLDALPEEAGSVLEVGAGPGLLSEYARAHRPRLRWVASDIVETPWNGLVADALRLPVKDATLDAIVGLDLVHHLARPLGFFTEAARVLAPHGRIVTVEPWVTPFSYPLYRWLHQEGCRMRLDPWRPFEAAASAAKDAFEGDAAVLRRLVETTPAEAWRKMGVEPPRLRALNGFAYVLSLGFKGPSLLPRPLAPLFLRLDDALGFAAKWLGLRALAVWERT